MSAADRASDTYTVQRRDGMLVTVSHDPAHRPPGAIGPAMWVAQLEDGTSVRFPLAPGVNATFALSYISRKGDLRRHQPVVSVEVAQ